jgi:glycosyltransferase involved in cell wall biosynthesis
MLHQHFKTPQTGGALRSYYLAKALVDKGISTIVITTHNATTVKKETVEGIEVHYLPIPYDNRFGFVKRIVSFLKFVWSIVREAGEFRDADICYAVSTPLTTGIAAIWIKSRYKIPYYFEVGDLWPEAPVQMGIIKNFLLKAVLYRLEKSIYKRAKAIVALSESIREYIQQKVGKEIHVIPNMADTDFYKPEAKRSDVENKFGVRNKFVVSYIGTMGLANGLEFFLACAEASIQLPIQFLLCGEGAMVDYLKRIVADKKLNNVTFVPAQDRNGVRDVMNVTDAAFVSFKPLPVLETGSPNKYFDALAAGKFIVVNFGGWVRKEVEENGCGIFVDSAHNFVTNIKPLLENSDLLIRAQQKGRTLATARYSRTDLSGRFTALFH